MNGSPLVFTLSQVQSGFSFRRLFIHAFALIMTLTLPSNFAWGYWKFWQVSYAHPLVLFSSLAYICAAGVVSRLRCLPRTESIGLIFLSTSIAYLAVMAIVALGRFYYSRSFLLVAYFSSMLALLLIYRLTFRDRNLLFAVVPGGMARELMKLEGVEWLHLYMPEVTRPIDGVVVDLHQKLSGQWVRFISNCSLKRIPVYHAAVVFEATTGRVSLSHLSKGLLDDFRLSPLYVLLKRMVDILLVLITSPLTLPLLVVTAVTIKLSSLGAVFFLQERIGQGGRPFRMVKFRSMRGEAGPNARFASDEYQRITGVGRILRRYRLDELPQLWNILKGDMSLIGPRPEQVPFAAQFEKEIPFYVYRHLVKPGLTGWAQVTHGYAVGVDQTRAKLEHDLYYIKYFSFWLDLWILGKTLRTVLTGFGAR